VLARFAASTAGVLQVKIASTRSTHRARALRTSAGISAGAQQAELSSVLVRNSGNATQARGIASSQKNVRSS
jgi:hypothetical protein